MNIKRREVLPHDVEIEITYCGICHSDLHAAKNDWGGTSYPTVPGHEIVGRVTRVGDAVTKFKVGDSAGIGCIVDSCRECQYCKEGLEQFCVRGNTIVFGSPDKFLGGQTFGGYAESIVADENYLLKMPEGLDPAAASPLLCGGITIYSPLKHWSANTGKTKMEKTADKNEGAIFPKGEKAPADNFTETVYVQMLAPKTGNNNFSIGSVTFEPGARSNWHTHPAGQTLLVTEGLCLARSIA